MLSFFRKIRHKLIEKENLKRYLVYGIGEILLVVIGILIALQINTWNQESIDEKEQDRILQDLSEELQFNIFLQEKGHDIMQNVVDGAQYIQALINDKGTLLDTLKMDHEIHKLTMQWMSGRPTSIYDVLSGSGDFDLIQSPELRKKLTNLKANQESLLLFERLQFDFVGQQLKPFLNRSIDRTKVQSHWQSAKLITSNHTSSFASDYDKLLQDREFANLLLDLIFTTENLTSNYGRIKQDLIQIDSLIGLVNPSLQSKPYIPY